MNQSELESYLHSPEEIARFTATAAFGDRIFSLANDKSQGLGFVFDKARAAYLEAFNSFTNLDLQGANGLTKAIALQADMRRYIELVSWLDEAVQDGANAKEEIKRDRVRPEEAAAQDQDLTEEMRNHYGTEQPDAGP